MDNLTYQEHLIPVIDGANIYAREYAGSGPLLLLLHGFPDNIHLYDYLVPALSGHFRIVAFDFLGWGASDKPRNYAHTADDQRSQLESVINFFNEKNIWLVAHDASGPPAINYALDHPDRVERLVLLNTYYSFMKVLRTPEAILMFSTPIVRIVTGFVARNFPKLNKRIYYGQVGKFMTNEQRRAEIVPKLFASFSKKENFKAFLKLNADLLNAIRRNNKRIPEFRKLNNKTLIIFGENDPYLNVNVAEKFHSLIPGSAKAIIKGAGHYVQVDAPGEVAEILIKSKNKPIATHY